MSATRWKSYAAALIAGCLFAGHAEAVQLIGINPEQQGTAVLAIETSPFSVSPRGSNGVLGLSGLDFQPGTGTLFGSGGFADGGNLYTIDPATGAATPVGPTGFPSVPGLAFDPLTGALYGSAAVTLFGDGLIAIDPSTGAGALVGLYGQGIVGLDGIAIDPTTGILYGASGFAYDGSPGDIFSIDKATGAATLLGSLTGVTGTVAGLSFDSAGHLFGSLGSQDGQIISIDLSSFTFTVLGDAADGSISDIAVVPAPEPGTLTLFAAGLAGIGLRRRRRVA